MAKLYYYYGAMGSSKTANALMTRFNYEEIGQKALLCKPKLDTRDGERKVRSRIGLEEECVFLEDLMHYTEEEIRRYQCIVVDEVQFATPEQISWILWTYRWYVTVSGQIFRTVCSRGVSG